MCTSWCRLSVGFLGELINFVIFDVFPRRSQLTVIMACTRQIRGMFFDKIYYKYWFSFFRWADGVLELVEFLASIEDLCLKKSIFVN